MKFVLISVPSRPYDSKCGLRRLEVKCPTSPVMRSLGRQRCGIHQFSLVVAPLAILLLVHLREFAVRQRVLISFGDLSFFAIADIERNLDEDALLEVTFRKQCHFTFRLLVFPCVLCCQLLIPRALTLGQPCHLEVRVTFSSTSAAGRLTDTYGPSRLQRCCAMSESCT
ncbi:hypothetical protein GGR57DRAFT_343507 [Xylariaceae sp. FL1272]|nr:hypothetical protein GGR57DRAFT_343507 [Xylariaceae sp. FL1272]